MKKGFYLCLVLVLLVWGPLAVAEGQPQGLVDAIQQAYQGGELLTWTTIAAEDEGYLAVVVHEGRNVLCIFGQAEGQCRLLVENRQLLPTGSIPADAFWLTSQEQEVHLSLFMDDQNRSAESAYYSFIKGEDWRLQGGQLGDDRQNQAIRFRSQGQAMAVWPAGLAVYSLVPHQLDLGLAAVRHDALLALCQQAVAAFDKPQLIPDDGGPYALPQGRVIAFAKNQRWPVYLGPGSGYPRAAEGKAQVSSNDWIQVFGREGDWLMVQYNLSPGRNRIGWITAKALPRGEQVPQLAFSMEPAIIDGWMTDDPLRTSAEVMMEGHSDCLVLATMGKEWRYIEGKDSRGRTLRGFVPTDALALRRSFQDQAVILAPGAELQDEAGQPLASYLAGTQVRVLGQDGDRLKVRTGRGQAVLEGWMQAEGLAQGAAPSDFDARLPQVNFIRPPGSRSWQGLSAPHGEAAPVDMSDYLPASLMGYVDAYAHLQQEYGSDLISFFMPRDQCLLLPGEENLWSLTKPMRLKEDCLLSLDPQAGIHSNLQLYKHVVISGVPLASGWFFTLDNELMGDDGSYRSLGYLPLSLLAEAGEPQPLQLGRLKLPGDEQLQLVDAMSPFGPEVLVTGARLLLIGQREGDRLVRDARGAYAYVPEAWLERLPEQGLQQEPHALGLGWARLRLAEREASGLARPFPNWGQASHPPLRDGQELMLLSRVDGWWQVYDQLGQTYLSSFVPEAWLPDAPAAPALPSFYDSFRDLPFQPGWWPNPPLVRVAGSAYALLRQDNRLMLSRYEQQGDAWQRAQSFDSFLGEGIRAVDSFQLAGGLLCLDAYGEGSHHVMHACFSLTGEVPSLSQLRLTDVPGSAAPPQPERWLSFVEGGFALEEGGQSRFIPLALPSLGVDQLQLLALVQLCQGAIQGP